MKRHFAFVMLAALLICTSVSGQDAEPKKAETVKVFDAVTITIPAAWKSEEPKSRIVEREFSLRSDEANKPKTRVTLMAAGGGVDANIKRWEGQFSNGNDAVVEKMSVAGQTVHYVKLEGTYKETMGGGPFSGGKTVMQEDYSMLGGIIEMKDGRQYFIKMIGPKSETKPQEETFKKMLQGIEG
jgi:hypothetical protein